jgi:hypothetical protein
MGLTKQIKKDFTLFIKDNKLTEIASFISLDDELRLIIQDNQETQDFAKQFIINLFGDIKEGFFTDFDDVLQDNWFIYKAYP